ncbi:hypothetical protein ACXPWS_02485 [Mycobacterium sp. BMJ-28]
MAPNDRFRARKQPRQARGDPGLHRVLFEEAPRSPALLARLREAEARAVAGAAELLRAHPEVTVADPVLAARMTVATIESLVHRLITQPVDAQHLEDEIVAMLAGYLRSTAADPAAAPPPA